MNIEVVPINCRLSERSLRDILEFVNAGMRKFPISFKLMPHHRTLKYVATCELMPYIAGNFPRPAIAVVSRSIEKAEYSRFTMGIADDEQQVALVKSEPGYVGRLRNEGLAQTIIHEYLHLLGQNHHRRSTFTPDGLYCPFMHYGAAELTSLEPCIPCSEKIQKYLEQRRAA